MNQTELPAPKGHEHETSGTTLAFIAVGGAAGTLLRYTLSELTTFGPRSFPTTTFAINITGAFALGLLLGALARHPLRDSVWRPLVGVGLLGGYTTFSTFAVETVQLARADRLLVGAVYVIASVGVGLLAARFGERLVGATPALIPEDEA